MKLENDITICFVVICLLVFVETHALRVRGGRGWGVVLTQTSGYNFPLFLVYPVDMPENVSARTEKVSQQEVTFSQFQSENLSRTYAKGCG